MHIHTVKKGIRSNHTIRWGGHNHEGTNRNGIICGTRFVNDCVASIIVDSDNETEHKLPKKYAKYFPQQITFNYDDSSTTRPEKRDIIKFDSNVHCCQMCGGSRFNCKVIFQETNQYGKGVYRTKKYVINPMDDYDDYLESNNDFYNDSD